VFKFKNKNLTKSAVSLLLIFLFAVLIQPLSNPALSLFKQPLGLFAFFEDQTRAIIFYHRNYLQNKMLSRDVDILQRKLNDANETYLENERLRNLLSLKQKSSFKVIAASVIGRSPDSWSSVIIINKGRLQGIKQGFVVLTHLGLAGRIVEVANTTSKVMLINDPNVGVSALIQRSRQEGLVSGTLGSLLVMRYLPKDADVQVSDVVVTSGFTDFYPKGLIIGNVVDVGDEFPGLSRYCMIKPVVELSNIEEVLVIIP